MKQSPTSPSATSSTGPASIQPRLFPGTGDIRATEAWDISWLCRDGMRNRCAIGDESTCTHARPELAQGVASPCGHERRQMAGEEKAIQASCNDCHAILQR